MARPRSGWKHTPEAKEKMRAAKVGRYAGEGNPMWRGGELRRRGRVYEHTGEGPRTYKARARRVLEEKIGRPLKDDEDAHHINGIVDDDRPENLEVLKHQSHARHHSESRPRDEQGRYR